MSADRKSWETMTPEERGRSLVEYYESIGGSARVLRHDSFEDVQAMTVGVDPKLADELYGAKPAKSVKSAKSEKSMKDDGKREAKRSGKSKPASKQASGTKRKPQNHPEKGSRAAREQMAKLRALRGKSSTPKLQESKNAKFPLEGETNLK